MKLASSALLVLLSSVSSMAQTKTTFDRFKNTTHFMATETQTGKVTFDGGKDASILIRRMGMIVGFTCEGQVDGCKPTGVELLFVAHTPEWAMNGNLQVSLLIDGKPEPVGNADWDGQVLDAEDLVEYNDLTIGNELLAKLAGAKTVDVQIGLFEFSLTGTNLASLRDIASHAGWIPESVKSAVRENSEAGMSSPAAAAQLAQDGHISTPEELARLVEDGLASRAAIITSPAGAEVDIDGNRAGITPLAFVLIKRASARVITIKLMGYKTIQKTFIPDGKTIPLAITLEKER
jgi:hypothetical protein